MPMPPHVDPVLLEHAGLNPQPIDRRAGRAAEIHYLAEQLSAKCGCRAPDGLDFEVTPCHLPPGHGLNEPHEGITKLGAFVRWEDGLRRDS